MNEKEHLYKLFFTKLITPNYLQEYLNVIYFFPFRKVF